MRLVARVTLLLLVAVVGASCSAAVTVDAPAPPMAARIDGEPRGETDPVPTPSGTITIAVPASPAALGPWRHDDPAAADLAAIWGLPLYRLDSHGQLVPAMVRRAVERGAIEDGWVVELAVRTGSFSDGTSADAFDVVHTIDALRATPRHAPRWDVVTASAPDAETVRLRFDVPYPRWPWLLAELSSVIPSEHELGSFDQDLPASGGLFDLTDHVPGLSMTFAAHVDGPLGPPVLAELVVLFVPSYDTALGLLQDGTVDAVIGHHAINAAERARTVEGVVAEEPVGGTVLGWTWRADRIAVRDRARMADVLALDLFAEGMLQSAEAADNSVFHGLGQARTPAGIGPRKLDGIGRVALEVPRGSEVVGFAARALQRAVSGSDGTLQLAFVEPAAAAAVEQYDTTLMTWRLTPWPSLAGLAGDLPDEALAIARAADRGPSAVEAFAQEAALAEAGGPLAFADLPVAHAWHRERLDGIEPSSWVGAGFASVGRWQRVDADG